MIKFLLYSSALVLLSGTAGAGCIQTPSCSSLGYSSTTACEGGLKCPWGNAWFCNVSGGGEEESKPDYSNCKIGDILYSDMTCNTNMVASKTPIGVVFDVTNTLAIAKDEFANLVWGAVAEDVSGVQNSSSVTTSTADWQGFNNTKAMYEADKSGGNYPAIKKVLTYSTAGTSQGQWYLPAAGELQAISTNKDTLNATLSKIGGTQMSNTYWSSSEANNQNGYYVTIGSGIGALTKANARKIKPIINFGSKNKIDVAYNNGGTIVTCKIGDILYSDRKCYSGGMLAEKTPIGIVFDASRRTAIALESSSITRKWGVYGDDIPGITNITDENKAKQDFNGKANTAAIKAYNSSLSSYPAAKYAYEYKTTRTYAGEWYLPALGELNTAYTYKDFLNYALSLLGKNALPSNYIWSSSEFSYTAAWLLGFGNGDVSYTHKDFDYYVLPVLAF